MKKLLALVVSLVLLTAALPLIAADGPAESAAVTLTVPEVSLVIRGETEEAIATVSISYETAEALLDGVFVVNYDADALELQVPKRENTLCKLTNGVVNVNQKGVILLSFMNSDGLEETGTVAELPFKVLDIEKEAEYPISIYSTRLMCADETPVGRNLVTEDQDFLAQGKIAVHLVDVTQLQAAVENPVAKLFLYTDETVAAYTAALEAANAVLENPASLQQDVDGALAALTAAAEALAEKPPVTPQELAQKVETALVDLSSFTDETAAAYNAALNAVKEVLANANATPEERAEVLAALDTAQETLVKKPVLKGDVDGDGDVTSTDARLTLQLAVDKIRAEDIQNPDAVDVDGDGDVTSTDARLILQKAVNKIADFPA